MTPGQHVSSVCPKLTHFASVQFIVGRQPDRENLAKNLLGTRYLTGHRASQDLDEVSRHTDIQSYWYEGQHDSPWDAENLSCHPCMGPLPVSETLTTTHSLPRALPGRHSPLECALPARAAASGRDRPQRGVGVPPAASRLLAEVP